MKFSTTLKLNKATANDVGRYAIEDVYFDKQQPEHPVLVATNSRILAVAPVSDADGDSEGFIAADTYKQVTSGKRREVEVHANGNVECEGTTFPRPELTGMEFPDWRNCVPDPDNAVATMTVNVSLLRDLLDAIGCQGKDDCVRIHVPKCADGEGMSIDTAILLEHMGGEKTETNGAFGVLMPYAFAGKLNETTIPAARAARNGKEA